MDVVLDVLGVAVIHFGHDDCYLTGPQQGGAQGQCPGSHGTSGVKQSVATHQRNAFRQSTDANWRRVAPMRKSA